MRKTKSRTYALTFLFGSGLFWWEIDNISVLALLFFVFCNSSIRFLIQFLGMDFGTLELKSHLHQ